MLWSVEVSAVAAPEPVTVAELRAWTRLSHAAEDGVLADQIAAARDQIERACRLVLRPSTLVLRTEHFPRVGESMWLPRSPLSALTSISYLDTAGVRQTWEAAKYRCDLKAERPRLVPAHGQAWPAHICEPGSIEVTVEAGYADAAAIPPAIKKAVALLGGIYFEDRVGEGGEETLPGPVAALVRRWLP